MRYIEYNHNYKNKRCNDCVIRAIGFATNKDWCSVFEDLSKYAMKQGLVMNDRRIIKKYINYLGYPTQKMPKRKDNTRYTVQEFADELAEPNATYILLVAHHLTVIKNKNLYDTWNCSNKSVGNYWVI